MYDFQNFPEQVVLTLISQLTKKNSRSLQQLLEYFNGTVISIFFVSPFFLFLNFKDSEFAVVAATGISLSKFVSSLWYCHNPKNVSKLLSLCWVKLYIGIIKLTFEASSTRDLLISVAKLINDEQFLNIAALFDAPVIISSTITYETLQLHKVDVKILFGNSLL